jgi:dihydrofolate reductase
MIKMIWAQGANGELGNKGKIPWHLPEDMEYFKQATMGSVVIMGRKTLQSMGKPLPGRENIMLTKTDEPVFIPEGVWVYDNHIKLLNDLGKRNAFVIGGRQIYDLFMPFAEELYITNIHETFEADTYAPKIPKGFIHIGSETHMKDTLMYQFSLYKKLGGF